VPDNKPWSSTIRTFALQVLRRLQAGDAKEKASSGEMDGVTSEEDDKLPEKEVEEADQIAQSQYLPVKLEMPIEQEVVRQHVELMFALTKKIPEFLDE
jgi:symplekin